MTSVEREQTNKHTNTHIHTHIHKHTYRVKTEETFFTAKFFIVYFSFSISLKVKKTVSNKNQFWALCGEIRPLVRTEFPRVFCVGIGPLQLHWFINLFGPILDDG